VTKSDARPHRAKPFPTGSDLLHDPRWNKSTAFTEAERDHFGLRGLLPARVFTQEEQQHRVLENFRVKTSALEKYIYLISLQDRNEQLFYKTVLDHIDEMMPIIYTPTVGEACKRFGAIFRRPRGLYISARDRGRVREILRNWPEPAVGMIVVTDGERILGLGDLGAQGMGIPIGKLSLYTACAGIDPSLCLPVTIDVGTNNEELLHNPLYIGLVQPRIRGQAYEELIEEFVLAVQEEFPGAVIQFEDFATENALTLLAKYRDRVCTFNDDIQGTAAVALAGLISAGRITGQDLTRQRVLFLGAGSAATGIGDLIVTALVREGVSLAEARRACWFIDRGGLVTAARTDIANYKRPYAHPHEPVADLLAAVEALRPTALIGVSAQPQTFTEPVVKAMVRINPRPIIFPLSNPTSKSECTAEQAYQWSDGRAVFASGSPFDPVTVGNASFVPRQGNNAYIFPGLGLGVLASGASRVTDAMFYVAARALAEEITPEALAQGSLYPPLRMIRQVSARIAEAVAREAYETGLAVKPRPQNLTVAIKAQMFDPTYQVYL
jgi:malate dehydrogenase (oxaloacetate-decarboxylating)(NADP+)